MTLHITGEGVVCFDPDLEFGKTSGKAFMRLRVVSKDRKKDMQGKWVDGDETFFDLTVFGKQAEMLAESQIGKGTRIVFAGKAKMEKWTTREGQERDSLRVVADSIGLDVTFTAYQRLEQERADRQAAVRQDTEYPVDAPF